MSRPGLLAKEQVTRVSSGLIFAKRWTRQVTPRSRIKNRGVASDMVLNATIAERAFVTLVDLGCPGDLR